MTADAVTAPRVRRRELLRVVSGGARTTRGLIGLALAGFVVAVAVIGPFLAPNDPNAFVTSPFADPSAGHPLGGDSLGRDVLSRVLDGGQQLLLLAALATALGIALGAVLGVYSGYSRGLADTLVMRGVDVFLAFPQLVFVLLLVSVAGANDVLVVVAVGLSHAPQVARVLRAVTLDVSERDFVHSVELNGVPSSKVMTGEILPNITTPLLVEIGLRMTYSVVVIAGLSFIGFGLPPPQPNWGTMINENRIGLTLNAWATMAPALLIAVLTIGMNTLTDALSRVALGIEGRPAGGALSLSGLPPTAPSDAVVPRPEP